MRLHTLPLIISGIIASPALAADFPGDVEFRINRALVETCIHSVLSIDNNAIDWKVGDSANYKFSMRYGKGTMVQAVTRDEGSTLWMRQTFKILGQKQVVDVQLDKVEGKVIKVLQNGKEVEPPADDDLDIISADETFVTVPAGKFQALHIVANASDGDHIETWINPAAVVMDGTIKQIVTSDGQKITLELTSFKHGS